MVLVRINKFFFKIPRKVVLYLSKEKSYISKMARDLGHNRSAVAKVTKKLERFGILSSKKLDRIRVWRLTEDGEELAKALREFTKVFNKIKKERTA